MIIKKKKRLIDENKKVLGLCFLIYDIINYEELWNDWLKNVDKKKYKIYIHYKNDVKLNYFEKYKLKNCIDTKYADISLVKAQNLLLEASINDNCGHQILLSNSCIPLKPFDVVYTKLIKGISYFNLLPIHTYHHTKKGPYYTKMDISKIHKTSQWCILSTRHSKIILKDNIICEELKNCYAPDELVYLTILYQYKNEFIITNNLNSGATTFTNWSFMNYPYKKCRGGLKNYNMITTEELDYLLEQPCLFGRKFISGCIVINNNIKQQSHDQLSKYLTERICY